MHGARALLEHGLSGLALLDISTTQATEAINSMKEEFPSANIIAVDCDIRDAEQVNTAIEAAAVKLGGIDILCSFAGVVGCTHAIEMTPEEWRRTLDINTTGGFLCAQACAKCIFTPRMKRFTTNIVLDK